MLRQFSKERQSFQNKLDLEKLWESKRQMERQIKMAVSYNGTNKIGLGEGNHLAKYNSYSVPGSRGGRGRGGSTG